MKVKYINLISLILALALIVIFLLAGTSPENIGYLMSKRLPKILAIILVAIAIAVSSVAFQTVANNRILTPSILGLESLYILIQTGLIFFLGSRSVFNLNDKINFFIALLLMVGFSGLVYGRLLKKEGGNLMKLLLIGFIIDTLFTSLASFMQMLIDPNEYNHIQDRVLASFSSLNLGLLKLSLVLLLGGVGFIYLRSRRLDLVGLGRSQAINLGLDYDRFTREILFGVAILVAVSTALVGPIRFLGVLVSNLARQIARTNKHRELLVLSSLISVIFLLLGQLIIERYFNFSLPIGVVINFIGGSYFMYLLLKESSI